MTLTRTLNTTTAMKTTTMKMTAMKTTAMKTTKARAVGCALAAAALLAGCSSTSYSSKSGAGSSPTSGSAAAAAPVMHGPIGVAQTSLGAVLTDSQGKALYRFAPDSMGHSACMASCLKYWPAVPVPSGSLSTGSGGPSAQLGSITRADGTKQLSVNGYPVYTYVGDTSPGAITGQGLNLSGGTWWVLAPSGSEITSTAGHSGAPSSSPAASTSSSARTGYGSGY